MSSSSDIIARPSPAREGENTDQFDLMVAGKPYIAWDAYLGRVRDESAERVWQFNQERNTEKRMKLAEGFVTLLQQDKGKSSIALPFSCEYGFNIRLGYDVYIGPDCQFIDVCPITVGNRTMFGGSVKVYTPAHPISPEERNGLKGPEWAKPITIGEDCWIGGGVIICPGVTIGNGVTIGAGAVVTRNIEDRVVAVGNPARPIKKILADGTTIPIPKA
ncbi:hypothetical protein I302_101797 [Kwoniella bestiolae CBS 10118]|uniref:Maltose/galactoside acetyltransferase domain-containing protein n=1 Tax=Kwoniella bestiolae CBS 10118 TaxID=1296100 RepID=A0A1B9GD95_9TREE|nr:hypothetical protein I302_00477 [Kwoniella bestiolae CBS 10118]OCF28986.1 hypothetical protein I302_00477 [Kwoniella bestiolae CBS 10118]